MNKLSLAATLCAASAMAGLAAQTAVPRTGQVLHLVACAPGYPSNTEQAEPTMNDFAAMVADASGWPHGTLTAEYHPAEAAGVARLRDQATSLALVPLPLFLKYERELALTAILQAVQSSGSATETWSLVAPAGTVDGPAALADWELLGLPAYAHGFIRGPALASWGPLPDSTSMKFTRRILGGTRRAAAGEQVAVLLDGAQIAALASFPDAAALEIVATSPPLPGWLIVAIGDRVGEPVRQHLVTSLSRLQATAGFAALLETMHLERFEALDSQALDVARAAYAAAR